MTTHAQRNSSSIGRETGSWRSWAALTVAPSAWFLHLVASLTVTDALCAAPAMVTANGVLLASTAVALAASGTAAGLGIAAWWQLPPSPAHAQELEPYIALLAVCVGVTCTIGITWAGVPLLVLGPCATMR